LLRAGIATRIKVAVIFGGVLARWAACLWSTLTCSTGERRTRASAAPHQVCPPLLSQRTMAQRSATSISFNEADIRLALLSINTKQLQSNRRAAAIYNVSERTIRRRRAGVPARRNCQHNSKKLTQVEEEVIVTHILDLDQRGFAPALSAVRDMADKLLAGRSGGRVESTSHLHLSSVQTPLKRVLIERTTGREPCARILH
jgi:hypothetical protein